MEIYTDAQRRDEVLGTLLDTYRNNAYPFNLKSTVLPQDSAHLPPRIRQYPERFAFYLFCLCYFMSATDSITATKCMTKLYKEHPRMFRPKYAARMRAKTIEQRLTAYGLGFREDQVAKWWVTNAKRLVESYDGSVLVLKGHINTYEDACDHILNRKNGKGFFGFQHKMVSMILYYLMATELMDYFHCPVPVDFHILRITLANKVVTTDQGPDTDMYTDEMLSAIRKTTFDFCVENNISWLELSNAMWPFGKAMCRYNPGNKTFQPKGYAARKTVLVRNIPIWTKTEKVNWEKSCNSCVIKQSCSDNIGAAEYYRKGKILLRGERTDPTEIQDSFFGLANVDIVHRASLIPADEPAQMSKIGAQAIVEIFY